MSGDYMSAPAAGQFFHRFTDKKNALSYSVTAKDKDGAPSANQEEAQYE